MKSLYRFLSGTLRGRLIVSVAMVHAVMMALFIGDLTSRQRAMLLERQIEEAEAISQSLATSAAGWIASDDVAGLQELADAQRRYPEIIFVILADKHGRVLADTDSSRKGLYLLDLPHEARQQLIAKTAALVDIAVPATIGERHVGWVRIGIGQQVAGAKLADIIRNGVIYALSAILIGSVVAWSMGRRITRRLYAVQETIGNVRAGDRFARSSLTGDDEAAVMAREFNTMLDTLAEQDAKLRAGEERFRSLFENSPVSIWEEDFSGVKALLDELRAQAVIDLDTYLDLHPEIERQCAEAVRIIDVNQAALALHEAASNEELLAGLDRTFTPESYTTFRDELIALWDGRTVLIRDAVVKTLSGAPRNVTVYFSVCPGYERTISKVMVSLVDITKRKQAEESIHLQTVELEQEVAERQIAQESLQEKTLLLEEEIEKRQKTQDELEQLNESLEQRVHERTAELEKKNQELQKMNKLFVGRELRMVELKEQIKELETRK